MNDLINLSIHNEALFSIINSGDRLNRHLVSFIKRLSKFMFGGVIAILLIPVAFFIIFFTTIIAKFLYERMARDINKMIKEVDAADERNLMKSLISLEELHARMSSIKEDLGKKTSTDLYYNVFFGSSFDKCVRNIALLRRKIEATAYPEVKNELDEVDIARLLKAYEGINMN